MYANEIVAGRIYFFDAMKQINPSSIDKTISKMRYQKWTKHSFGEGDFSVILEVGTFDNLNESLSVSPTFANVSQMSGEGLQKFMAKNSHWVFSFNIVVHIIEGDVRRKFDGSVQVPPVIPKIQGGSITYVDCADCMKSGAPHETCSCATTSITLRFKARFRLGDDSCEFKTTCFDATKV